ncbi:MAG TPA: hypothetical protein VK009_23705 [Chloroflexota bacterium]|nr:hypothetical protein [Chloroflexota bacterium]
MTDARPHTAPAPFYAASAVATPVYLLVVLTVAWLALALAFARATPLWQAPDEPAHYNYVVYLAQHGQLPVLQEGDYPAGRIPIGPEVRPADVSTFRYESHQPPLFYALGALAYKLHPTPFALRALSALLGAALLPVVFLIGREALPGRPWLQLGLVAFAGFVPMQLFIAGAIENDTLAELVLSLLLLGCLWRWRPAAIGLLFGLALLTKVTIYLPAFALVAYYVWREWRASALVMTNAVRHPRPGHGFLASLGMTKALGTCAEGAVAAVIVCGWWFVRNGFVYGWLDALTAVQVRQAQVAGSQTQTGLFGPGQLWTFVATSFHSFWGQFGWMSIPLPERDYRVLIILTLACGVGWLVVTFRKSSMGVKGQALLWLTFGGVLAGDLIYNLKFLQPQGRYLFPALAPIAVFYVCGFAGLFPKRMQPHAVAALSMALVLYSAVVLQRELIPAFR